MKWNSDVQRVGIHSLVGVMLSKVGKIEIVSESTTALQMICSIYTFCASGNVRLMPRFPLTFFCHGHLDHLGFHFLLDGCL